VKLLSIPYRFLFPAVLFLICIGVYSVNNNSTDVLLTLVFGIMGFYFNRHGFPSAPLLLGFVLGPLMEENFRRALVLSDSSLATFVDRPISAAFLAMTAVLLVFSFRRKATLTDDKAQPAP
jgi:putative tricarboxylic transport membrane protein